MTKQKLEIIKKYPYFVKIPKSAKKCYFYGRFDIVQQTKALSTFSDNPAIVRCQEPFTIKVKIDIKDKLIKSKQK